MSYELLSDTEILKELSQKVDKSRRGQEISEEALTKKGGVSKRTYNYFINDAQDIKLSSFIKILRGLGKLNELEKLLPENYDVSPFLKEEKRLKKRIRKTETKEGEITWGDGK